MVGSKFKARLAQTLLGVLDILLVATLFLYLNPEIHVFDLTNLDVLKRTRMTLVDYAVLLAMVAIWRYVFIAAGMYRFRRFEGWIQRLGRTSLACFVGLAAVVALAVAAEVPGLKALFLLKLWVWATAVIFFLRILVFLGLRFARQHGRNLHNVVVLGLNERSAAVIEEMRRPELGFSFRGYFDENENRFLNVEHLPYLGNLHDLQDYVARNPVDQVIIALPIRSHYDDIAHTISLCAIQGIQTWLLADLFDLPPQTATQIDRIQEVTFVSYHTDPRSELQHDFKRLVDICLSFVGLVLLAPVFLLLGLLIAIDDGFPVFFVQDRVGLNKRLFKMFKFRTMVRNAEKLQASLEQYNEADGAVFKLTKDPRITRIGHFLRRTSLDELPQLLNVFLGSMSLVGPRPLPVRDFERFYDDSHRLRFSVKPGITGMWQVSGRSDVDFEEWMRLDSFYVRNWSIMLDFMIMIRTFSAVFTSRGAY